ncbi:efflux RND transporter periplasmic adaptor subunit [Flavobacterium sp.]|jgi:multidrug efflux pump subunit AcrA (membrane-fusion protein)|uniref:efflux RND transporter periplasmic adaptor subunit n=1 Tax=Flavobacterium sp. TaxID=239 RepID=UPI002A83721B|nr:HlyD family efflux transporter periplasmic adaptor subunit [Flavobacterium sp.]
MQKIFLFIFYSLLLVACKHEKSITPQQIDMTESIYSSVTIQPDSLYQVYAVISGILEKTFVEEGNVVTKNQTLFKVTNTAPELNAQNAKLALDLANDNYSGGITVLQSIKDEINAAQLKYKNDSINYFRQKNLWDQKIGSKIEFDTKKLNYDLAKNNLITLQSKLNRTKNELYINVKQAKNNYNTTLVATKDYTIKSSINGKIYAINKNLGELINTNTTIATLGSANQFIVEMLVDEVDIVKVIKGQQVIINLDAYKGEVFTAKVTKILPKKDERNQTFKVEAVFNIQPKVLYPGLSGEANIVIGKRENVVAIPIEYLLDGDKVKTDAGIISIKTGMRNMEYIEVLSGITEKTILYKTEE